MVYLTSLSRFLMCISVLSIGATATCQDDEAACLQRFRAILTDPDHLWFGRCDTEQVQSYDCKVNPSQNRTLLSRLLPSYSQSDIQSVAANVSLVDVVFSGESAPHFSCGHQFPSIRRSRSGLRVDPLQVTKWSIAQVQTTPTVSWPAVPGVMKYALVVLDMGFSFLHGLYINCRTSMADGQAVYPYSGSKNPRPQANAFLWVVLPQFAGDLDIRQVQGAVYKMLADNDRHFHFADIARQFGFGLSAFQQSAMTLLNIEGDAFGAEYIKSYGYGNYCPLIASRNPYLYLATKMAQIPAVWSDDVNVTSTDPQDVTSLDPHDLPYLTSVDMVVDVTYNTGDIEFESCCSQKAFLRAQLTPDPFKAPTEQPERPVQVRDAPRVRLSNVFPDQYDPKLLARVYTLMLVDFGGNFWSPSSLAPLEPALRVHWLVTNISRSDVNTGFPLIPYFGSNPFDRNSTHMYTFLLLEQTKQINYGTLQNYVSGSCRSFPQRCAFRVNQLLADWGLNDIRGVNWFFAEQDAFARQRIYHIWSARYKATVCNGIPGYSENCCVKS